ncbi:ferric reductase [Stutzerimonas balearica]|jgi:predicted ferric reductase|uniref:ferredoxin reductase family protein n=1 Tax=Stutzerimonas balearica TaxID=74829 RepID=UPI00077395FE|nr:ferric reductase-like transmembrane domain-containing protein [Stutzerimonas balearica]MBB63289.1 ferric reductase [Pseudomonas sp.]MBC7199450.1 ferric reductase-like transmembrane domain-containing protein [Stutzerimonas balearica]MBD3736166.1 ferric reductase-like transmembrane domain-containing protein [Stutzerimonas balearica]MCZ4128464.1 ferric reductase-like transmembrane domain-containing protein [Stutzerimonas balearica]OMG66567.1 ferric reductase [Stutzerimonas balearica]
MKPIKLTFIGLFAALVALWLMADDLLIEPLKFWPLRSTMVHFSGVLVMGAMSVAIFLAARPVRMEPLFDGLDKTYRLHKWLGIASLVLAVIHWGWAQIPKWLVGFGWLERPARRGARQAQEGLAGLLQSQRGLAETIGEWAFYGAALLIVLALIKRFPYRWFFKTHRWLAALYLLLVFHSVVLMPFAYWRTPLGLVMGLLLAAGSWAAVLSLSRQVGRKHKVVGRIEQLTYHKDNRVLQVDIGLEGAWPGHKAGQFAFVTFDPAEGPHPFSISSAWRNDGKLTFAIKGIGDYTRSLPQRLQPDDAVTVEGPYGCFDFRGRRNEQIWVAGGIGIAPFIGRLQALALTGGGSNVELFYCTSEPDQAFIERIRQLAEQARVRLHLMVSRQDGRLTPERLRQMAPSWKNADVWFCGPASFGQSLRDDLIARGLSPQDFHQELFNMR